LRRKLSQRTARSGKKEKNKSVRTNVVLKHGCRKMGPKGGVVE